MNIIVRCGCGGIQNYIKSSMDILKLAPVTEQETFVGKEKIRKLAEQYPGTPLAQHLGVVAKKLLLTIARRLRLCITLLRGRRFTNAVRNSLPMRWGGQLDSL